MSALKLHVDRSPTTLSRHRKEATRSSVHVVSAFGRIWQDSAKHGSGVFFREWNCRSTAGRLSIQNRSDKRACHRGRIWPGMAGFCEARLRNFFSASGTVDPPRDAFRFKTAPTNALAIVAAFGRVWPDSAKHGSRIFFREWNCRSTAPRLPIPRSSGKRAFHGLLL
jgi:hypothetical protein